MRDICRYVGHDYPRPYFVPVMPKTPPNPARADEPVTFEPIRAYASQQCRVCGCVRVIDYGGKVVREGYNRGPYGSEPGDDA